MKLWLLLLVANTFVVAEGFVTPSAECTSSDRPRRFTRKPVAALSSWYVSFMKPTSVLALSRDEDVKLATKVRKRDFGSLVVTVWIHLISIFIVVNNYRSGCWPSALARVPLRTLSLVHAISGMLFSGSIMTTTILEWLVVSDRDAVVNRFWFKKVPLVEQAVVIPALTGIIVSGVGQSFSLYGTLRSAPRHVKGSLGLLTLFGLWWAVTDKTTQHRAQAVTEDATLWKEGSVIPAILQYRRVSNVISCFFLVLLYAVMTLKPQFKFGR